MDYVVERIPGKVHIDPEGGKGERRLEKEKPARKGEGRDSVSISEEARRRSVTREE